MTPRSAVKGTASRRLKSGVALLHRPGRPIVWFVVVETLAFEHEHQRRRTDRQDASFPAAAEARDRLPLAVAGAASKRPEAPKRNRRSRRKSLTLGTTCKSEPDGEVRRRNRISVAEAEVNQPVAGPPGAALPARARASSAARSHPDGTPCSTPRRPPSRSAAACTRRTRGTRPGSEP